MTQGSQRRSPFPIDLPEYAPVQSFQPEEQEAEPEIFTYNN
jgi:hypothetical protein